MLHFMYLSHMAIIGLLVYMIRQISIRQTTNEFKYLVISATSALMYCFFSFMDLCNTSLETDIFFIQMMYLSASYLVAFFLIFIAKYCKIKIPRFIYYCIILSETLTGIFVLFDSNNNVFFINIKYIYDSPYNQAIYDLGPLFWWYSSLQLFVCVVVLVILLYKFITSHKNTKIKYATLLIACILPLIIYLLKAFGIIQYYNYIPFALLLSSVLINRAILRYNLSDIVVNVRGNIIDNFNNPIIITDPNYRLLDANSCAIKTFPYLKPLYETRKKEPKTNDYLINLIKNDEYIEFEINDHFFERHISIVTNNSKVTSDTESDVTLKDMSSISSQDKPKSDGFAIMFTDTTQSHIYIQELNEAKNKALEAAEAKSRFLANASHELRTPMNAIIGFSELLLTLSNDDTILNYSQNINQSATSLLTIINDILDSSKIEKNKMEIVCTNYDPFELFDEALRLISIQASSKGLTLNSDISPDIPSILYGDKQHILQITTNLLSNAVKYTHQGFVTLKCDYDFSLTKPSLIISVIDSGIGIKEKDIPQLFEAFTQSDKIVNASIEGTGLGLSICKELSKLMDGTLDVKSVYNEGSTFTITIPQAAPTTTNFTAKDAKILVVDDSNVNLALLSEMLKEHEIIVDTAFDGLNALTMIAMKKYDLVFLDHMMPGIDGMETLNRLRQTHRENDNYYQELPVIMLTANVAEGVKEKFLSLGASDYISKPVNIQTINDALLKWLEQDKITFINDENVDEVSNNCSDSSQNDTHKTDIGFSQTKIFFDSMSGKTKEVDPLDGLNRSGNSLFTYTSILDAFINACSNDLLFLKEIIDLKNLNEEKITQTQLENIRLLCHTLKNSAYAIGADNLWKLSKEADSRIADKLPLSKRILEEIYLLYINSCEDCVLLSNHIKKNTQEKEVSQNDSSRTDLSACSDLEITLYLNNIIASCDRMDSISIGKYLTILYNNCPIDKKNSIKNLINYAENFEYDDLIVECKIMIDELHSYIIT